MIANINNQLKAKFKGKVDIFIKVNAFKKDELIRQITVCSITKLQQGEQHKNKMKKVAHWIQSANQPAGRRLVKISVKFMQLHTTKIDYVP